MGKYDHLIPCPHCGSEMRAGSLKRHAPICIKNPAAFARILEALASAPGSKRGITCGHYIEISTVEDPTLPTVVTLRRLTGARTWDALLTVFGLLPPAQEQQRSQCPHCGKFIGAAGLERHRETCAGSNVRMKAEANYAIRPRKPRTVPPPQTCPQCGLQRINMGRHVCPEDPATVAWLAEHLPDPSDPERMISSFEYQQFDNPPISCNAITVAYGSWAGLAARYGLKLRRYRAADAPELDKASHAELHRLAAVLHGGNFGPSYSEYCIYGENVTLLAAGLEKRFGTWGAVLGAAGLRSGTRSEYAKAANARRRNHQAPQNERRSFDRGDEAISRDYTGIPVFPNPRPLKSGGVAWTVR